MAQAAELYRMVMKDHLCPYGLKSKDLLEREGLKVKDYHLKTKAETEAFKKKHKVGTTPQTFINGKRIGGYEDLLKHFGRETSKEDETTYQPVMAIFGMSALMAVAAGWAVNENLFSIQSAEWFIAFSMCLLAVQKLRDIESFATMFLNYDLLAQKWVRYGYVYPFAEGLAGVLMISGALMWLSIPVAAFIGTIGAVSVIKAVYIDKRELKCACVGGDTKVPLGAISLTENVMMIAMAIWMLVKPLFV